MASGRASERVYAPKRVDKVQAEHSQTTLCIVGSRSLGQG
jgi:hypothetical protein